MSGYHLAFTVGATSVAVGIVTALVMLRRHEQPVIAKPADDPQPPVYVIGPPEIEPERQAA